ncbi:MAG: ComF family protein [Lachnospiraceae bacterium]|nr:ComF family protein [Lachnospiraceae bacterium]
MYQELWNLLYPKRCPVCFEILNDQKGLVCPECYKKVKIIKQPYCYQCGKPLLSMEQEYCYDCRKMKLSFDRGFSIVEYDAVTAPSILAVKYKNRREFLKFYGKLGKMQYEKILKNLKIDAIIPVPLSRKKQKKRGFNQAALFGKELARWIQVPINEKLLIRGKDTIPLKELAPLERRAALKKVFYWQQKYYQGEKIVLLVDDIYTSGATVEACTRILKENGIKKVYILTMAIGRGNS